MQWCKRQFPETPADPDEGLRNGLYNGRRHYVFNARGEQVGNRKLKDMPGAERKRWETRVAHQKRSAKLFATSSTR